jgi:hypothetical protein
MAHELGTLWNLSKMDSASLVAERKINRSVIIEPEKDSKKYCIKKN